MARRRWGPNVESAVEELGIALDARGLIPLVEARRRVRATKLAVKGQSHSIAGQQFMPTDFDFLWASLLSLEDAGEFVREACRITWNFHPRGFDNLGPVERYGAAIVPWLAHALKKDGSLPVHPWCVKPCLIAIDTPESLAQLFRIAAAEKDQNLVPGWLRRHGKEGQAALDALAASGHDEARALELGGADASWLADLDDAMKDYNFPLWENANVHPAAMRVSGFQTSRGGALVFESMIYWPGASTSFTRKLDAFGPGWDDDRSAWGLTGGDDELVSEDALRLDLDGHSFVDLVSGEALIGDGKLSLEVLPPIGPFETFTVEVREQEYTVPVRLPSLRGIDTFSADDACRVSPRFALFYQLADRVPRDDLFADSADLADELELDDAELLFRFDDWRHPTVMEKASDSEDLVAMVDALVRGTKLTALPSKRKNASWRHFIREVAFDNQPSPAWAGLDPREEHELPPVHSLAVETENALRHGFPHLRQVLYREDRIGSASAVSTFVKKHLKARQTMIAFDHRAAWGLVRTLGESRTPLKPSPLLPDEARGLLAKFLAREEPPSIVQDFVFLLEALLGGPSILELLAEHELRDAEVIRCLGHVLRRQTDPLKALRKTLARQRHETIGVILRGNPGVKQGARGDGDLCFASDAKLVSALSRSAKWVLRPDPQAWLVGGDAVISAWLSRMDSLAIPGSQVVFECGNLKSKRLAELLLSLPDDALTKQWVEHRFKAWPEFLRPQLQRLAKSGALAKSAKAMLRKL